MRTSIVGRSIVTIVAALLLVDGSLQLASPPMMVDAMTHSGFSADSGPRVAVFTLTCALLLIIPRLAPLGAVLTTGFLGGAIATHFRIDGFGSPPQLICLGLGIVMWLGMVLADRRFRTFLPAGLNRRSPAEWPADEYSRYP
ncbi:DoxX family protein [Aurantimonas sp. HBX-1]|uniref:DoxX family protein n=1 Tax=Aurantimonas sp. HBX-1 TaxID=2906072 RepID=UPI001F197AFE|nr:DoxX family protein [Aurantimonas sp. HBX-1]UIJ72591.1 DoxX family protein [Aurantimonas sp. HBX-1]